MKKRNLLIGLLSIGLAMSLASCEAESPYIGSNGNWWVGNTDLGVQAQGPQGPEGDKGDKGDNGINGKPGADGVSLSVRIGINGNWYIDGKDTGVKAKGSDGSNGKSAYEIYLEKHPEYNKSEDEWLDDLVNGKLGNLETHIVKFDTNGGSKVNDQIVNHLDKIEKPNDPTKLGYKFLGWFVDDEKWVFSGYNVTSDMVLKAKWEEESYNVSIKYNNGSNDDIFIKKYGDVINIKEPIKEGFIFDNWTIDDGSTINMPFKITSDLAISANWTDKVQLSFDSNGGSYIENMEVLLNTSLDTLPIPTKEDYKFEGWYYNDKKIDLPYKIPAIKNVTLVAKWKSISGDFSYENLADGTVKLTGYNGNDINITTPNYIGGKKVTVLGSNVFKNNALVLSITLNDNLKVVEEGAFNGCLLLNHVSFGKSFTTNKRNSEYFSGCNNLKGITITNNNEILSLFANNESNIPESFKSLTILYNDANTTNTYGSLFNRMEYSLFDIKLEGNWNENNINFSSCSYLRTIDLNNLSLKALKAHMFEYCPNLQFFVVPNGVTTIEGYAFRGSRNLNVILLPKTINDLKENSIGFMNSILYPGSKDEWLAIGGSDFIKLRNVYINNKATKLEVVKNNYEEYILSNENEIFEYKHLYKGLYSFDFNKHFNGYKVYSLRDYAFENNEINYVTLSDDIRRIGNHCFSNCPSLCGVHISKNVQYIGDYCFTSPAYGFELVVPKTCEYVGECGFYTLIGNITVYIEGFKSKPLAWNPKFDDSAVKILYDGQWEYDSNNDPRPIINK